MSIEEIRQRLNEIAARLPGTAGRERRELLERADALIKRKGALLAKGGDQ